MSSYCGGNAMCGCTNCPGCQHHEHYCQNGARGCGVVGSHDDSCLIAPPNSGSDPIEEAAREINAATMGRLFGDMLTYEFLSAVKPALQRLYDAGRKAGWDAAFDRIGVEEAKARKFRERSRG